MPNDWADAEARAAARAQPIVDYGSHIAIASVASLLRGAYARGEADALAAFRAAAKPEPEGEMVTLALMEARADGRLAGTSEPDLVDPRDWTHIANLTFPRPPLPVVPTIKAEVEAP